MNKIECRKKAHQILMSISKEEAGIKSLQLSKKLYSFISTEQSLTSNSVIGAFSPIQNEPLWFFEFAKLPQQISLPHIKNELEIDFYCVDFNSIKNQKIGLRLDKDYLKKIVKPDLLIIPGLAFGKNGERLGRGKGYYDRYLEHFKGLKIGICFEDQILDKLPMDKFDQRMNIIITDKNIYEVKGI